MLQPKLHLRVSQRQVLTPGLVQMVNVLALNKLELKEMISAEVVGNPLLEEIEDNSPSFDELAGREGERERSAEQKTAEQERTGKDPFEEIDFGSYFQDYLDPGYRTGGVSTEDVDAPTFEHFLAKPSTLTDHLLWQLRSMVLAEPLRGAAELIVGNLEESGYLSAPLEELFAVTNEDDLTLELMEQALRTVQSLDPIGVGARNLTECLELQIASQQQDNATAASTGNPKAGDPDEQSASISNRAMHLELALRIVQQHIESLQKRDVRELSRLLGSTTEQTDVAIGIIRALDPRPGQRFSHYETRLIEPDVAFTRRGDAWSVLMNEEDLPALRLNAGYRRMLRRGTNDREVQEYVKERYRSAIQLLRNIEQRKNTIVRTCEAIVRRQTEFLERGVDGLRPMMIKEVAEEIGVHPSTVSRAVSNKYVYTPQGVYELRFFFSEGVNGPDGGDLPLLLLKKKVKKLIEEENPAKPLTDDALVAELQRQGIQVTRRSVAKYREDMQIPSTHQRRRRA